MGNMRKTKTLLDSVHGNIEIPIDYFNEIIDTPYFQRLRRIEQNSCRSVFPSARHDRFIHSIGVFHLGSRIANAIMHKCGPDGENNLPVNAEKVIETYRLACLLHDIGHTPFSHTFEEYFNYDILISKLKELFNDNQLNEDIASSKKKAAEHEVISAYVAVSVFRERYSKKDSIDWMLLARMITGFHYLENKEPKKSFENAMIELIHGDIIDADGLDYVCRDVWAGGYRNFNIDLSRLINSIFINRDEAGNYSVSYSSKALNEIETVLNVKNFQYLYVINHHKVLLEQYYLVEAMKSAACYHQSLPANSNDEKDNALRSLCDINIFLHRKELNKSHYKLYRPTDDDFIALMKLTEVEDQFIGNWFSRNYVHTPLWKSKLEYFNIFKHVLKSLPVDQELDITKLLLTEDFRNYICERCEGMNSDDIIVIEVKPKVRSLDANKINVSLNGKNIPYSELNHDMFSLISIKQSFCYVYVDFSKFGDDDKIKHIQFLIDLIKDFIASVLRKSWNNPKEFFYK